MLDIYSGSSDGFRELTEGYIDYAKEVIVNRSVPDIRDGLKPVHRRVLYSLYEKKQYGDRKELAKSMSLTGMVLHYHPHGDTSVYDAMCRMTDLNGSFSIPLLRGQGNLGVVYSDSPAAASRYTYMLMNDDAVNMFFQDMEGCEFGLSESGDFLEPVALPVRFPYILVNSTTGMAVSVGTKIPSFNFWDVIDLTQKYLKGEDIKDEVLVPDYPTGGYYIYNINELKKIMMTGNGAIKLRAEVEVNGREIIVSEIPYGRSKEKIREAILKDKPVGLQNVIDASDYDHPVKLIITCASKAVVDDVLLELYRRNLLQTQTRSNILTVMNDVPVVGGVFTILEKWVEWRKEVVKAKFTKAIEELKESLPTLEIFNKLLSDPEAKEKFLDLMVNKTSYEAKEYLISKYGSSEAATWICGRRVSAFNGSESKYKSQYETTLNTIALYQGYIENVEDYIYNDLEDLKKQCVGKFARRTKISKTDYKFSRAIDNSNSSDSHPVSALYTLSYDGWLKKVPGYSEFNLEEAKTDPKIAWYATGDTNSLIVMFDNYGRILRYTGNELADSDMSEMGQYIPNLVNGDVAKDYQVMYMTIADGSKKMLIYRDGYVGFLDTAEFQKQGKKVHVLDRGVCPSVHDMLVDVVDLIDDDKEYLMVCDWVGSNLRYGMKYIKDIPESRRVSRRKVFSSSNPDIIGYALLDEHDALNYFEDPDMFMGKLRYVPKTNKVLGDVDQLIQGHFTRGE